MLNIEKQKEKFKNHVATFTNYGNIKILDFKDPKSTYYRIRFLFEEDWCRLHISGDLGQLIATNYNNMCYEGFTDFLNNTGYFESKIDCLDRAIYEYDYDIAKQELEKRFEEYDVASEDVNLTDEEYREEKIEEILEDLNTSTGLGTNAYDILIEIDSDCWEYISDIGKEQTGILELYMLAFKLAQEQLYNTHCKFKCTNSFTENNCDVENDTIWMRDISDNTIEDTIVLKNEQGMCLKITNKCFRSNFIPD